MERSARPASSRSASRKKRLLFGVALAVVLAMVVASCGDSSQQENHQFSVDGGSSGGSGEAASSGADGAMPLSDAQDSVADNAPEMPRNLALYRAAYHSSAANYDNTAHLATDGDLSLGPIITAEYTDSPPGEEKEKAFDGTTSTKYLTFHTSGWIEYQFPNTQSYAIDRYTVSSGNDQPGRDPKNWTFLGSNDGSTWTTLDTQTNVSFAARQSTQSFPTANTTAFKMYRFDVSANSGDTDLQFSQIGLYEGGMSRVETQAIASEWTSGPGDAQWIYVDLGAPSTFNRVKLYWDTAYATSYRIDVSPDAASWNTVYTMSSGKGGVDDIKLPPTSARYVRMYGLTSATMMGYSLIEFEVYGTGGVPVTPLPQPPAAPDGTQELTGGNWRVQRASRVTVPGELLSQPQFDDTSWVVATVPGTVLSSYLDAGALPDPNFGDQQFQISEAFFTANFWYRDSFVVPQSMCGKELWLNFDGINWRADVFLNGSQLGSIAGAFVRGRFDITAKAMCGGTNVVAVLVHRNDDPGAVKSKSLASAGPNGGVLGADNPTIHASIGWDWMATIRGRDIGIQDHVYLSSTGPVSILDPFVSTTLPLPATSPADLAIALDLENNSTSPVNGTLSGTIDPGGIQFTQDVSLAASERKTVTLDKNAVSTLSVADPQLWWPNGYGAQNLYTLTLTFDVAGVASDTKAVPFGMRQITWDTNSGILTLYVNGRRIFVRGGNWGMSESMLRLDDEGYDTRVRLHKEQNFTMIRNWIGMTGSQSFYKACDKYGILIWDDFWLANPADGPDPNDPALFMTNARDKILRVRNHPSLALYCGRNEGEPPATLAADLQAAVQTMDGTRPYISNSAGGVVDGGGPYSVRDPAWYFRNNGPKIHSEVGMPNVPSVESMRAMMSAGDLWPISETWSLHDFCDSAAGASSYSDYIAGSYGQPAGIEDYCVKAQMVNMENYKAIFEGYAGAHRNGVLLWMSQSAWPSTVWQTFDYYLEPTAAYFGAKHACEPLHILWDASSNAVKVTNNSSQDYSGLSAEAKVYNLDGSQQYANSVAVESAADSVTSAFTIAFPGGLSPTHFVRLRLTSGASVLSDNFYWRGTTYKDYTALAGMPMASASGSATSSTTGSTHTITATVTSPGVALMIRLKLLRASSGDRVLPTVYSDNYFSLLPGESKQVTLEFDDKYLAGNKPKLMMEGWNVASTEIAIP